MLCVGTTPVATRGGSLEAVLIDLLALHEPFLGPSSSLPVNNPYDLNNLDNFYNPDDPNNPYIGFPQPRPRSQRFLNRFILITFITLITFHIISHMITLLIIGVAR